MHVVKLCNSSMCLYIKSGKNLLAQHLRIDRYKLYKHKVLICLSTTCLKSLSPQNIFESLDSYGPLYVVNFY